MIFVDVVARRHWREHGVVADEGERTLLPGLSKLTGNETWDELRTRFGEAIGLSEPVPDAALRRALLDANYAHRLIVSRNSPKFLAVLLSDPDNRVYELPEEEPSRVSESLPVVKERSNIELARSAAKSMLAWGRSGFTQVSRETYERRMSACNSCSHLVEAPVNLVYRVRLSRKEDMRTCNLCGCVVSRKAWLPTEKCPGVDPSNPRLNLWGEPR